jgi:hypothetical protein
MRCIAIKFIPQLLTNDPKQQHVNMHLERWEKVNEDLTFISRIALFPKLKAKLKGQHFETLSDIKSQLQEVLTSIKENVSTVL